MSMAKLKCKHIFFKMNENYRYNYYQFQEETNHSMSLTDEKYNDNYMHDKSSISRC